MKWPIVALHDICRPKQWPTISSTELKDHGYPVYGANGKIGHYDRYTHKQPTILITCRGATCGTINVCEPFSYVNGNAMALDDLDARVNLAFLAHYLRVRGLGDSISGSAQPQITRESLRRVKIPLPPLEEQRRIAAILDKSDALSQKRRAALQKLDSLTQSIFLDMFGVPATNPKGLPQIALGEIAQFVGGGTPSREVEAYFRGSICWATSKDMKGEVLQDTQEHITEEAIERSATKLVGPGNVLVVVKSKVLLHRLPVLINRVPTCFGQDLKAIVLPPQWPARYIARHLRIDQQRLLDQARGINTEGLTLEHLRRYKLLSPPCGDLSRYDNAEERIESLRNVSLKAIDLLNRQFGSLQNRAFRGQL